MLRKPVELIHTEALIEVLTPPSSFTVSSKWQPDSCWTADALVYTYMFTRLSLGVRISVQLTVTEV